MEGGGTTGIERMEDGTLKKGGEVRLTILSAVQKVAEKSLAKHGKAGAAVVMKVDGGKVLHGEQELQRQP